MILLPLRAPTPWCRRNDAKQLPLAGLRDHGHPQSSRPSGAVWRGAHRCQFGADRRANAAGLRAQPRLPAQSEILRCARRWPHHPVPRWHARGRVCRQGICADDPRGHLQRRLQQCSLRRRVQPPSFLPQPAGALYLSFPWLQPLGPVPCGARLQGAGARWNRVAGKRGWTPLAEAGGHRPSQRHRDACAQR